MCDAVYLNQLDNLKQWYTIYENENKEKTTRINTVILTNVKVKSINEVALPDRSSNTLRGYAIKLGTVYICDGSHDEITEKCFSREVLNHNEFILQGKVEIRDDESKCNEDPFYL